jgi:hypothetical protein
MQQRQINTRIPLLLDQKKWTKKSSKKNLFPQKNRAYRHGRTLKNVTFPRRTFPRRRSLFLSESCFGVFGPRQLPTVGAYGRRPKVRGVAVFSRFCRGNRGSCVYSELLHLLQDSKGGWRHSPWVWVLSALSFRDNSVPANSPTHLNP